MTSYIVLARDHPDMSRPFASPFGVTGAMTALLIALAAVLLLFANPEFRSGLYATAVLLVAGIVYFVARRRHRLIAAPEETFALALKDREKAAPPAAGGRRRTLVSGKWSVERSFSDRPKAAKRSRQKGEVSRRA